MLFLTVAGNFHCRGKFKMHNFFRTDRSQVAETFADTDKIRFKCKRNNFDARRFGKFNTDGIEFFGVK